MGGPWENYQTGGSQAPPSAPTGPWSDYGGTTAPVPAPEEPATMTKEAAPAPATMTKEAAPAPAPEMGFFDRMASPGGIISPENVGTVGGGLIGGALGSAFGPPGTYLGAIGGAGLGAMAGRGYESLLYGTQGENPLSALGTASQRGMIGQATGEGLAAIGKPIVQGIARRLPGSVAAQVEMGIDKLRGAVNNLLPKFASGEARAAAMKYAGEDVPLYNVMAWLRDAAKRARGKGLAPDEGFASAAEGLANKINLNGNKLSLADVQQELSDIGVLTNNLRSQGKDINPLYSEMFGKVADAMEKAPHGAALRDVAKTYRKEQAVGELLDEIDKVVMQKRGTGTLDINANRFVKNIQKKVFLRESFEPNELDEVMGLAQKLIEMPPIPAPLGASIGSGRILAPSVGGYGIEHVLGLPQGAISGPIAAMTGFNELMRVLLPTVRGRAVLKRVLAEGPMTQQKIAVLTATARGITGRNLPPPTMEEQQ